MFFFDFVWKRADGGGADAGIGIYALSDNFWEFWNFRKIWNVPDLPEKPGIFRDFKISGKSMENLELFLKFPENSGIFWTILEFPENQDISGTL